MPPGPNVNSQPRTRWDQRNVMQQKAKQHRRKKTKAAKLARKKHRK